MGEMLSQFVAKLIIRIGELADVEAIRGALPGMQLAVLGLVIGVVGVLTAITVYKRPGLALVAAALSTALSGYSLEVGPGGIWFAAYRSSTLALSLRPDYIVVPAAALGLLARRLVMKEGLAPGRIAWLGLLIVANLLSTLLRSPDWAYSFRMLYLYLVGAAAYFCIVDSGRTDRDLRRALNTYAAIAGLEALFALTFGGRWLDVGTVRLHGSLLEPNLLGLYAVPLGLIFL